MANGRLRLRWSLFVSEIETAVNDYVRDNVHHDSRLRHAFPDDGVGIHLTEKILSL